MEERAHLPEAPKDRDQVVQDVLSMHYMLTSMDGASRLVGEGNIKEAIQRLRLEKDKVNGIDGANYVKTRSGHAVLLRPTDQDSTANTTYHDWAIMGLNYIEAAKKLLAVHGKELTAEMEAELNKKAAVFLEKATQGIDPALDLGRLVHAEIVPFLQQNLPGLPKKKIQKQLADARDFCNFDHPTVSIATTTSVPVIGPDGNETKEVKKFMQIDVPVTGSMPDKLKKQYHELASVAEEKNLSIIPWYDKQPKHIKKLIRMHAKDVLDGKTIPTQLRKHFPGIRNAAEGRIYSMDEKPPRLIHRSIHSGTPGHLLGDAELDMEATSESLTQLSQATQAQNVLVLTLLSPGNLLPSANDLYLVKQIEQLVDSQHRWHDPAVENQEARGRRMLHRANIPLNALRKIPGSRGIDLPGAEWLYHEAQSREPKKDIPDEHKKNYEQNYQDLAELLTKYEELRNGSGMVDPENINVQLCSVIKRMAHLVNEIHKVEHPGEPDFIAVVESCQSGKDRRGLSDQFTAQDAIETEMCRAMGEENAAVREAQRRAINKALNKNGHVTTQAGLTGGTLAASGIKKDTKGAVPESQEDDKKNLIQETASYNKGLPKNPDKQRPWYKNPKFWVAAVVGLVGLGLCATGIGALAGAPILAGVVTGAVGAVVGAAAVAPVLVSGVTVGALAIGGSVYQERKVNKENKLAKRVKKQERIRKQKTKEAELEKARAAEEEKQAIEEAEKLKVGPDQYVTVPYSREFYRAYAGSRNDVPDYVAFSRLEQEKGHLSCRLLSTQLISGNEEEQKKAEENLALILKDINRLSWGPEKYTLKKLDHNYYALPLEEKKRIFEDYKQEILNLMNPNAELSDKNDVEILLMARNMIEDRHIQLGPIAMGGRLLETDLFGNLAKMQSVSQEFLVKRTSENSFEITHTSAHRDCGNIHDPYTLREKFNLQKQNDGTWMLTPVPNNEFKIHPAVWQKMLAEAKEKLGRNEFEKRDLFSYVPLLQDEEFAIEFKTKIMQMPEQKMELLKDLIIKCHGTENELVNVVLKAIDKRLQSQEAKNALKEAKEELERNKFKQEDLKSYVPFLKDQSFAEEFMKAADKIPAEQLGSIKDAIIAHYGKSPRPDSVEPVLRCISKKIPSNNVTFSPLSSVAAPEQDATLNASSPRRLSGGGN